MKACLSEKSISEGPPKSCDVLYYYESLQMATGRHRDAFSAGELHKYYTTGEKLRIRLLFSAEAFAATCTVLSTCLVVGC